MASTDYYEAMEKQAFAERVRLAEARAQEDLNSMRDHQTLRLQGLTDSQRLKHFQEVRYLSQGQVLDTESNQINTPSAQGVKSTEEAGVGTGDQGLADNVTNKAQDDLPIADAVLANQLAQGPAAIQPAVVDAAGQVVKAELTRKGQTG